MRADIFSSHGLRRTESLVSGGGKPLEWVAISVRESCFEGGAHVVLALEWFWFCGVEFGHPRNLFITGLDLSLAGRGGYRVLVL